ncbi:MAG TPA: diguanylate cyclase [Xanthomonadaceae bacterium]|nr:diguanylate cyclase [Xanthomonadaceae bacterium]
MKAAPADAVGRIASIAKPIGVGAVVALSCWVSILTRIPGSLSTLWIASGVLTGVLVTSPRGTWRAYVLAGLAGNLIVRFLTGDAWYLILGRGIASTLDALLVAAALVHTVGDVTQPAQVKRVARVAVTSTIGACALSGAIATAAQTSFDGAPFAPMFVAWFVSHSFGMVIFATLTVTARAQGVRLLGRPGHRIALVLWMVLTALTCFVVFAQSRYPLLFLVYPPLLFGAFAHRFSGVVFGVTLATVCAVTETLTGHGPFLLIPNASPTERILLLQVFIASTCMLVLPVAIALTERGFLARSLRESEHRYRTLADYSRDLVVRLAADGRCLYVSPSARDMLGWELEELAGPRLELVHPDDADSLKQAIRSLFATGGEATFIWRARHRLGYYVWIEAQARLVPSLQTDGTAEIIYSGRDVTHRVEAEHALAENQRRLHAITDNLPAFVLHVDLDEIYTFANAPTYSGMGFGPAQIIGRTIREVVGEKIYAEIKPQLDRAFAGETVSFEIERDFGGQLCYYQSTYVPEVDPDGKVAGLYVMSSDISQLKRTERELSLLARYDGLTGLANRFHFNESAEVALARHRRSDRPIALLYMDIDYFKDINDSLGHAIGDRVLEEFAQRLKGCLRVSDFAARLGGDEFVVIVEDADSPEAPEAIARKTIAALSPPMLIDGHELRVTVSIGIAFCRDQVASRDKLLRMADVALYESKAAGRNAYRTTIAEDPDRNARTGAA